MSIGEMAGGGIAGANGSPKGKGKSGGKAKGGLDPISALNSSRTATGDGDGAYDFEDPAIKEPQPPKPTLKKPSKKDRESAKEARREARSNARREDATREQRHEARLRDEQTGKGAKVNGKASDKRRSSPKMDERRRKAAETAARNHEAEDRESVQSHVDTRDKRRSAPIQYDDESVDESPDNTADDEFAESDRNKPRNNRKIRGDKSGIRKQKLPKSLNGRRRAEERDEVDDDVDEEIDDDVEEEDVEEEDVEEEEADDDVDEDEGEEDLRGNRRDKGSRRQKISQKLANEAVEDYGFDRRDLKDYRSDDELIHELNRIDRRLAKVGRDQLEQDDDRHRDNRDDRREEARSDRSDENGRRPKNDAKRKDDKSSRDDESGDDDAPEKLEIDVSDWDDKAGAVMTSVVDRLNEANAKLHELTKQHGALVSHFNAVRNTEFKDGMSGWFAGLSEKYGSVFGEGPTDDLDPDSEAAINRNEFIEAMGIHARGIRGSGGRVPSIARLRERVLRTYPAVVEVDKERIREETAEKSDRRRRAAVHRPSNRSRHRDHNPDMAAAQFVDEFMDDRGLNGRDDDDDFDGYGDGV